jgi:hypothetical protein
MEDASLPLLLLAGMRDSFLARDVDRLLTAQLIEDLVADELRPWADIRGRPVTAHAIGRMLHGYRVKPVPIRLGGRDSKQARGYLRSELEPVWERYLPPIGDTPSDRHTVTPNPSQARSEDPSCDGVTLRTRVGQTGTGSSHADMTLALGPMENPVAISWPLEGPPDRAEMATEEGTPLGLTADAHRVSRDVIPVDEDHPTFGSDVGSPDREPLDEIVAGLRAQRSAETTPEGMDLRSIARQVFGDQPGEPGDGPGLFEGWA